MVETRYLQDGFDKRLSHVTEECGEALSAIGRLLAAIGKTQRWGPMSVNPELQSWDQETNLAWLRREMGDVRVVLDRLDQAIAQEFGDG